MYFSPSVQAEVFAHPTATVLPGCCSARAAVPSQEQSPAERRVVSTINEGMAHWLTAQGLTVW